jgi:hypothetical protein
MRLLGNHVLIAHKAIKRKSSIITSNNPENKDLYDVTMTILQLGEGVPSDTPLQVGQEIVLSIYATTPVMPIQVHKQESNGDTYMEVVHRAEDIIAIL